MQTVQVSPDSIKLIDGWSSSCLGHWPTAGALAQLLIVEIQGHSSVHLPFLLSKRSSSVCSASKEYAKSPSPSSLAVPRICHLV
ncbi:hypothetical protein VTL71DRAFT_11094, partial [Oculimacula yallundae]